MAKNKTLPEVEKLHRKIERWRRIRQKRSHMPEELWAAAVGLARKYGLYRMSQALRLRYDTLKLRLMAAERAPDNPQRSPNGAFVEVLAPVREPVASTGAVVELSNNGRPHMVVRLPAGASLDVAGLAAAFWSRT
jgi:hypothetical protein